VALQQTIIMMIPQYNKGLKNSFQTMLQIQKKLSSQ
jgi:hypothetical protein